jgi:hypothetical protein
VAAAGECVLSRVQATGGGGIAAAVDPQGLEFNGLVVPLEEICAHRITVLEIEDGAGHPE